MKNQWSNEQEGSPDQEFLEPLIEQAGLLNKEPAGPLLRPLGMGPLEQAKAPDQEPMEPQGVIRGSRSKDNWLLELGALYQESIGILRIAYPLELDGAPYQEPIGSS